ncbi:MAG: hypothetical protein EOO15_17975 [Chitinophagaceae bacterium]|nr:MAG: hypothetical protein EOO15_17975 [Chitinophagaceae bacterium]
MIRYRPGEMLAQANAAPRSGAIPVAGWRSLPEEEAHGWSRAPKSLPRPGGGRHIGSPALGGASLGAQPAGRE